MIPKQNKPYVLVVEDDPEIRDMILKILDGMDLASGYAGSVAAAISEIVKAPPDLVVLDLGLPDADGITLIENIRRWSELPILVLSARIVEHEKVKALDAGADDYLTKPFGMAELMARIRVLLRRRSASETLSPNFQFGNIEVDLSTRKVLKRGEEVHLSPIEFQLLNIFLVNKGRIMTHRQLLKEVWGGRRIESNHYLRIYVGHLRQKLEDEPARPVYLLTEAGVGYRLEIE